MRRLVPLLASLLSMALACSDGKGDSGPLDSGRSDGGADQDAVADAPTPDDKGTPDAGEGAVADAPDAADAPSSDADDPDRPRLSAAGLYSDPASKTLASDLISFAPQYELWSDGAIKRRWLRLPPGTKIDTSDMDHWRFPVGTQLWKEFSVDGKLVETRRIEHVGPGPSDFTFGAFVWNAAQTDAFWTPEGAKDVVGTPHDVPSQSECFDCHQGEPGRILGFSAVQLSKPDGVTSLATLATAGRLSTPPPDGADYSAPGDGTIAHALGYLHANCAHCHNPAGLAWFQNMILRLPVSAAGGDPTKTPTYATTVDVKVRAFVEDGYTYRIVPGKPDESELLFRMNQRGSKKQMPPLATEFVHDAGIEAIKKWIAGMTP